MSSVMRIAAVFLGLIAAMMIGSCGHRPSNNEAAKHNSDDVTFAEMMIPHHQQALDMAMNLFNGGYLPLKKYDGPPISDEEAERRLTEAYRAKYAKS